MSNLQEFENKKRYHILLVEDNPGDIDLIKEAFLSAQSPVELTICKDGAEAIQHLFNLITQKPLQLPDLILLDLNLPKKDGRQVLSEIKNEPLLKSVPIIVLTSSDAEPDIFKSYELGANSYIVKPIHFNSYKHITEVIDEFWFNIAKLPKKELIMPSQLVLLPEPEKLKSIQKGIHNERPIYVLLIEDNIADAELVKEYLELSKYNVFKVEHFLKLHDAIKYLRHEHVDVILTDLGLPDSQGLQTIEKIKQTYPDIPLVVLTSDEDQTLALESIKNQVQEFIVKGQNSPNFLPRILTYALRRKEQELEKTQFLAREQALRAEAEQSVHIRDEFLSIASHELKTPVTSLKLQIEILVSLLAKLEKNEIPFEKVSDLLKKADLQVDRFTQLINSLLDVTRIQAGRFTLNKSNVNLTNLIQHVLSQMEEELQRAGTKVELKTIDSCEGFWDFDRLEQVFFNLLTNAKKYAPRSPIDIRISKKNNLAIIEFQDYGKGISKEKQLKIFDRFERLDQDINISGMGLGLYIVRQIIDAHAGTITIESEPNKGTLFIIKLPFISGTT